MSTLEGDHLFKVFGRRPEEAVTALRAGVDRAELRAAGTTAAVIDASFTVGSGEIFVVMGLSGSGKSTLLRMLNGLLEPTSGRVLFDGQDLTALEPRELRRVRSHHISMVFQHFALFPHRSVLENAGYGLEVQGVGRAERLERAAEALALVGLAGWEKSWPDELSGGMQQRVGLARALATDADVLLMDESFSALDPLIRRDMQDQLLELQATLRKTIVFITHDLNEAMRLGDRIAVMRDGRIVQIGTAEEILVDPADDYVASFVQDVDRSRVLTARTIMSEPRVVLAPGTSAGSAVRTLRSSHADGGYVVEGGRRLVGAVTEEAVAAVADRPKAVVGDLMDGEPVTVDADTPLADLFTPCSLSGLPVAVTDEQDRLVGVVPREALLAALGDEPKAVVSLDRHRQARAAKTAPAPAAPSDAAAPAAPAARKEAAGA
ncbi:quaternary amine ABC transporter ATP-binding protein [Streptantibioticus cattleyicolor]|uniref:Putative glycine betaine ABC transporter ATP-binding protein n=1 Tax=Streptantibioticus cattleyicolor (strain ATCC 35852 / DSM 46488 / JCM 4925 / NBRC 14057 / NRRL 8057) TaxID=1003195 RepID=G8WY16_STREN|nr:glycine betaine/L-proline ABC transporter ATP-binding protein [Streptantibioticus cattleyicolor]AEW97554.1 putative glycine betaine ABC transporter ATP-binding protein [Streptantibioticus cattleyicolor NRRL 8057 = DSM 46488]